MNTLIASWLGFQPKSSGAAAKTSPEPNLDHYLRTDGARIEAWQNDVGNPLQVAPGSALALEGQDTYRKHYFCDWILGFVDQPGSRVRIQIGSQELESAKDRTQIASVLGRSPLLYGETIQESMLYRTQNVRKLELNSMASRLYGPSLRARTLEGSPLFDKNGKPVPTQILTAREHLEIAQINVILQKTPLVVLDLSSELMKEALEEGFRPAPELLESGKTFIVILPPNRDAAWAEQILGRRFAASLRFTA